MVYRWKIDSYEKQNYYFTQVNLRFLLRNFKWNQRNSQVCTQSPMLFYIGTGSPVNWYHLQIPSKQCGWVIKCVSAGDKLMSVTCSACDNSPSVCDKLSQFHSQPLILPFFLSPLIYQINIHFSLNSLIQLLGFLPQNTTLASFSVSSLPTQ